MKKCLYLLYAIFLISHSFTLNAKEVVLKGDGPVRSVFFETKKGDWGFGMITASGNSVYQPLPVEILIFRDSVDVRRESFAYNRVVGKNDGTVEARASIPVAGCLLEVCDLWRAAADGNAIDFTRDVKVKGSSDEYSFGSSVSLPVSGCDFDGARYFVPGISYGTREGLPGGTFFADRNVKDVSIREDRCPAPVIGAYMSDGSWLAVVNSRPDGRTSFRDASNRANISICDAELKFGSVTAREKDGIMSIGYTFPGSERVTRVRGNVPVWNYRTHPLESSTVHNYSLRFCFGDSPGFSDFYSSVWKGVYDALSPQTVPQDIDAVKEASLLFLSQNVMKTDQGYGIPNSMTPNTERFDKRSHMGFTGKALETANYLLVASYEPGPRRELYREQALGLFDTHVAKLSLSPPAGEGYDMFTGEITLAIRNSGQVYLRSYGDDIKAALRAVKFEKANGVEHNDWLEWCASFGDWLLTQQSSDGSFPRSWEPGTGAVYNQAPQASYNPIPMFVLLSELTGNPVYLEAALRAGEYSWTIQREGVYRGGTIDNPNAIDKEAGTLSLEAYLSLYEATSDRKWLDRAAAAADFSATWIYIWNVPLPESPREDFYDWDPAANSTGIQLISTGHSGADNYMCFDVDEYARLYSYTDEPRYMDIARILLHNTCQMMSLPGRVYGEFPIGYVPEHYGFAPVRGKGAHIAWLPWVSTSHLNGIYELKLFDEDLFRKVIGQN